MRQQTSPTAPKNFLCILLIVTHSHTKPFLSFQALEGNNSEKRSARAQQKNKKKPIDRDTIKKKQKEKMVGTITKQALRHTLHAFVVVPQI
jgi:hypothetical protein